MDVATELERVLSAPAGEPPHRDLHGLLEDARTRLRRRRLTLAGVAAVLVAVVGVGAASALSTGSGPDVNRSIATDPTAVATPTSGPDVTRGQYAVFVAGELVVADGVEVLEQVDNPFDYAPPDDSAALRLRVDGTEKWALAFWDDLEDGVGSDTTQTVDPAEEYQETFRGWVRVRKLMYGDARSLVVLKGGSEEPVVVPRIGVTLLDQRAGVDPGGDFTLGGAVVVAAHAEDAEGTRWFVLARHLDGATDYTPVKAADADGATSIDEFLAFARPRYASGEGLR